MGALADFLSKPILVGFLNIALSIMLRQLGKIFGFQLRRGIVPRLSSLRARQTHWLTVAVGFGTLVLLMLAPRLFRRVPAALVAMIIAAIIVRVFGLEAHGIKIVGEVPAGLPPLRIPHFPLGLLPNLLGDAAGLALVTFSSKPIP